MDYKIALIQANFVFAALQENLQKAERMIRDAAERGAKIICLPESFNQGYSGKHMDRLARLAEREDGETITKMAHLAKTLRVFVIAPIFMKADDGTCRNCAVLISDEGIVVGSYAKAYPIECEKNVITPGSSSPVFETKYGRIGILICNDLRFVEAGRLLGIQNVDIIFVPAAWRFFEGEEHWWEQMLCAHALNNLVAVAAVNRIGPADEMMFAGETMVVGADGLVRKKLLFPEEKTLIQEISLEEIRKNKQKYGDIFDDRRPSQYGSLCIYGS